MFGMAEVEVVYPKQRPAVISEEILLKAIENDMPVELKDDGWYIHGYKVVIKEEDCDKRKS